MEQIKKDSPLPYYQQVKFILLKLIDRYKKKNIVRLPGENELRRKFKLGRDTVRAALSELVKQELIYRKKGKGTFIVTNKHDVKNWPKIKAPSKANKSIGVIFPPPYKPFQEDPWFLSIMEGITKSCSEKRYISQWFPVSEPNNSGRIYTEIYQNYNLKGLIVIDAINDKHINLLKRKNVPFVQMGRPFNGSTEINYIDDDHIGGMRSAINHLVEHNYKRIAFIHKPLNFPSRIDLIKGYKIGLEENNIIFDKRLVCEYSYNGPPDQQNVYELFKKILKYAKVPFGLIISGDWAALGVVKAIKEKGLRIPEDVGIICCGDYPIVYSIIQPPLTAVKQQVYNMGFKSAELLIQTIKNNKKSYTQIILPTSLVVRDSCG